MFRWNSACSSVSRSLFIFSLLPFVLFFLSSSLFLIAFLSDVGIDQALEPCLLIWHSGLQELQWIHQFFLLVLYIFHVLCRRQRD